MDHRPSGIRSNTRFAGCDRPTKNYRWCRAIWSRSRCRFLTPIFHPNIAPHAIGIGDHWSPGEPLWSIVARIGEMIAYQSYNTKSPLNGEAARWVVEHLD